MGVRNYVGARYVPKFADPVEWQANTSYEAMVVVTYNNSSYTSKIPVPPTVGNPAENSKYWALTGNYNAQVEEYRKATVEAQEHARDGICANDEGINTNASKAYNTGDYFWWYGMLHRATNHITEGEALSTEYNVAKTNISDGVSMNSFNINRVENSVYSSIDNLTTALNGKIKYKVYTTVRQADSSNNIKAFGFMFDPTSASQIVETVPPRTTLIPIHAQYHYFNTADEFNDSNNTGDTLINCTVHIKPGMTVRNKTIYDIHVSNPTDWKSAGYYFTIGVLEITR